MPWGRPERRLSQSPFGAATDMETNQLSKNAQTGSKRRTDAPQHHTRQYSWIYLRVPEHDGDSQIDPGVLSLIARAVQVFAARGIHGPGFEVFRSSILSTVFGLLRDPQPQSDNGHPNNVAHIYRVFCCLARSLMLSQSLDRTHSPIGTRLSSLSPPLYLLKNALHFTSNRNPPPA